MAIIIERSPDSVSPAFNPNHWVVLSTNRDRVGFTYIADIYDPNDNTYVGRYRVPKRPGDGYGLLDASPIIRAYIEPKLPYAFDEYISASTSSKDYTVWFGEQYDYFEFDDNFYNTGDGRVGFTSSTQTHDFEVGDEVVISQDVPYTNAAYEGFHTVTEVLDDYSFVIDQNFVGDTGAEGGRARKSDGSPIVYSGLTSGYSQMYLSAFSREQYVSYTASTWIPGVGGNTKLLRTNMPSYFRWSRDNGWGMLLLPANNFNNGIHVRTYTEDNVLIGSYKILDVYGYTGDPTTQWVYAPFGPRSIEEANYNVIIGPTDIFPLSAHTYRIQVGTQTGTWTFPHYITLDRRCVPYENIELMFMDKLGNYVSWSFPYRNEERHRVKKNTFYPDDYPKWQVGPKSSGVYSMTYDESGRGYDVFDISHNKEYRLRTHRMNEDEAKYFMELLTSPSVYWFKSETVQIPVIINDGTYEKYRTWDDDFIEYEITIRLAYDEASPV